MTTPDLSGIEQIPDDPRGWLAMRNLPPEIQRREDSTAEHDARGPQRRGRHAVFDRDATRTERLLLEHLGHALPDELVTSVEFITATLRRRTWAQLEEEEEPNP